MNIGSIESIIRRSANKLGVDICRYRPESSELGRLATMLAHNRVSLIFDVGANEGQFASAIRNSGYRGRIVSFEPLSSAHAGLLLASQRDCLWEVAPQVALGDSQGEVVINIAGNSQSSSVLAMLDSHIKAAPSSSYIGSETVRLATLDELALGYVDTCSRPFIKIDTQGYESQVLNGATTTLNEAVGLQLELSLVPLYAGQELLDDLMDRIRGLGFSLWAIWPTLFDKSSGRMVQADATFFRDSTI